MKSICNRAIGLLFCKETFLFCLCYFIYSKSNAQTGPGGIGNDQGTSHLDVWLSDTLFLDTYGNPISKGDQIYKWSDISGNSNDATKEYGYSQPDLSTNYINGHKKVDFVSDALSINYDISPNVRDTVTIIAVAYNINAQASNYSKIFGQDNGGYDRAVGFDDRCGPQTFNYFKGSGVGCFATPTASIPFVFSSVFTPTTFTGWFNGDKVVDSALVYNTSGLSSIYVGAEGSYGEFWTGSISEFIIYDRFLSHVEEIIIHNYLSAKYDVSLDNNDLYQQDDAANGNYDEDVSGIGRIGSADIHDDSQGSGIVRILNPTNLDNNEFLFWGHDSGQLQAIETTDIPPSLQARLERVWRVNEVDTLSAAVDVGNVDLQFDLTDMGAVTASDLRLLVDIDNDGVFTDETPISGATSVGGNIWQFSSVSALANNVRFTLGTINTNQTPLPITLVFFKAVQIDNEQLSLSWQTASEVNNIFFTLKRSTDGVNWKIIKKIEGAGNSNTIKNYKTIDLDIPSKQIYYSLSQTDYDGEVHNLKTIAFNLDQSVYNALIYPNPCSKYVYFEGAKNPNNFRLYNSVGQDVTSFISVEKTNESTCKINTQSLIDGVYYLKNNEHSFSLIISKKHN